MITGAKNPVKIIIEARREEYSMSNAAEHSMNLRDLITTLENYAEDFGDDAKVVLSHDNGYTYGGIRERLIREEYKDEEEE